MLFVFTPKFLYYYMTMALTAKEILHISKINEKLW